jgi:hypothetical protein
VIKAEQDLPRTEGRWGKRVGEGGEKTQTMYAHVNKRIKKKKKYFAQSITSWQHVST